MGCGASKSKKGKAPSQPRQIADDTHSPGHDYTPPPAATIKPDLSFTWLRDRPTGSCCLTVHTLHAKFESDTGPVIAVGLGQYTRGTLSWKPHEADTSCTEFTYSDVKFYTTADDAPRTEQNEQFEGFKQSWTVDTSNGQFSEVIDVDEQIDFAVSLVLKAQGITRGPMHDVMGAYISGMRASMRDKVTGETASMSDSIVGAWTRKQQYAPSHLSYGGRDAVRMRRVHTEDPKKLTLETRDTMKLAIKNISDADDEIEEDVLMRVFASDANIAAVRWYQEDDVVLDAASMRPLEWRFEKRTSAEFSVRGEPHTSMSLLMKNTLLWDDGEDESLTATHRHSRFTAFSQLCASRFEEMQLNHVGLTRQAELAVKDVFDAVDTNGSGTIDATELRRVIKDVSGKPPSDEEVNEAMAQLDANKNNVIDWSEFRSYIVRQIADPSGSFKVDLVSLIGSETPIAGELFTMPKANGEPKVFHFRLMRSQGTLERFASRSATRPIERIMLGRFAGCSAVQPDAEIDRSAAMQGLHPFVIESPKRNITLYATTEEDRHKWVGAIKRAIDTTSQNVNASAVEGLKNSMIKTVSDAIGMVCASSLPSGLKK